MVLPSVLAGFKTLLKGARLVLVSLGLLSGLNLETLWAYADPPNSEQASATTNSTPNALTDLAYGESTCDLTKNSELMALLKGPDFIRLGY